MSDEEVIESGGGGDDIGTIVLMLGLYLIVLAFFILLNAISESSKEKRDLVVESVKEGFDFREEGEGVGSDDADITFAPLYEALLKEIEGIIQANLAIDEYDVVIAPERVSVTMDPDLFFFPGEAHINPDRILFFDQLGSSIAHPKAGMGVTSQVTVRANEAEKPQKGMDAFELAGRRSSLFTRALIDSGVKAISIASGAGLGKPSIVMHFDIYVADINRANKAAIDFQKVLNQAQSGLTQPGNK